MAPAVPNHLSAGPDSLIPQMSLSCNSPAQNRDLFLPFPHVSSIVTENTECVEMQQCWFPSTTLMLQKV